MYEGVETIYLGRPSSIPASVIEAAYERSKERRPGDSPWLNSWVGLCVPMAKISQTLNDQTMAKSEKLTMLRRLLEQVEEWDRTLPPHMAYDENRVTNMDLAAYGLQTQYCKVQILLRRALAEMTNSKKRRHSQMDSGVSPRESLDDSDTTTYQYGFRIARLVVTYREAFGLEEIPSIMLDNIVFGATVMIKDLRPDSNAEEIRLRDMWLRQLMRSLEDMRPHYPIVSRMLDSLNQMCSGTGSCHGVVQPVPTQREAPRPPANNMAQSMQRKNFDMASARMPHDNAITTNGLVDNTWNFDMDNVMNVFSSGGFSDSFHYLSPLVP